MVEQRSLGEKRRMVEQRLLGKRLLSPTSPNDASENLSTSAMGTVEWIRHTCRASPFGTTRGNSETSEPWTSETTCRDCETDHRRYTRLPAMGTSEELLETSTFGPARRESLKQHGLWPWHEPARRLATLARRRRFRSLKHHVSR